MATNNSINSVFPASPAPSSNGGTGVASPTVHAVAIAEGAAPFTFISLTNGQTLIGSTGNDPVASTLNAGTGISITNGSGSITISASGSGQTWTTVTGTTQAMTSNNGYYANNVSLVTLTLPTTSAVGDIILVGYQGAGGWKIAQNAGQSITIGNQTTTTGTGGSLQNTSAGDNVTLRCVVANTTWVVWSSYGNITYV